MYITDIKLVEWFSYISWNFITMILLSLLIGLLFFLLYFSFLYSSPQTLPILWSYNFFCESHSNSLERKRGLFDVKENYFYKCGNKKSLSFNHCVLVCVSLRWNQHEFLFIGRGENRHRGVSYRVSPQCGETAWKQKNMYFFARKIQTGETIIGQNQTQFH